MCLELQILTVCLNFICVTHTEIFASDWSQYFFTEEIPCKFHVSIQLLMCVQMIVS